MFKLLKIINKGFTLVEILVTISIMGLLLTTGLVYYQDFNRRQILNQAVKDLSSDLRLAQSRALAGEKPLGWCDGEGETLVGYRLEFVTETEYQLLAICSSSELQVTKTVELPSNVIGPNGTGVLFKVLAQGVETETNFLLQGFGQGKKVTVGLSGNIDIE